MASDPVQDPVEIQQSNRPCGSTDAVASATISSGPISIISGLSPDTARLVLLDRTYSEEICALEQRSYPHPWSPELIQGEFEKDVSLRLGLVNSVGLMAYCFNYLVVDELHILNLAVAPEIRSRGHGRKLLFQVMRHAFRLGARCATLEVRQSNYIAKKLYAGMGFEVVGMRKNYYRDNQENALVMESRLTADCGRRSRR